jgi:hypothetical protein
MACAWMGDGVSNHFLFNAANMASERPKSANVVVFFVI